MADKPLHLIGGTISEKEATVVSAGAGDAGELVALDGTGRLDESVLPVGLGADTAQLTASEALAAGDFINVHDVGGAFRMRKADAANARPAHGFVLAGVLNAAIGTAHFEGTNTQVAAMTPGRVFLSDVTPGGAQAAAPAGAGEIVQELGVATSATTIKFEPQPHVLLA